MIGAWPILSSGFARPQRPHIIGSIIEGMPIIGCEELRDSGGHARILTSPLSLQPFWAPGSVARLVSWASARGAEKQRFAPGLGLFTLARTCLSLYSARAWASNRRHGPF